MAIFSYAAQAGGGKIVSLDDQTVLTDLAAADGTGGSAFVPYLVATPTDDGGLGGWASVRRLVQDVTHDGAVTAAITLYRDGNETGQTITRTLTASDNPTVVAPLNAPGTQFQVKITLSAFDAPCGLGVGDLTLVPRRTAR